jgi:hypothetical protein
MRHIGAELQRIEAAACIERPVAIGHAGLAFLGLGVPKQHQAHGDIKHMVTSGTGDIKHWRHQAHRVWQIDRFLMPNSLAWLMWWNL